MLRSQNAPIPRAELVSAVLAEDADEQVASVRKLVGSPDPRVQQALVAWRGGNLFLHEPAEGGKVPFLLEPSTDSAGKARGLRLLDDAPIADPAGVALLFSASDLTPADTSSKLRKALKRVLDLLALANPDPQVRRDAIIKLGQEQNPEYLPYLRAHLLVEKATTVKPFVDEAIALTEIKNDDTPVRVAAIRRLAELRSINALNFLQDLEKEVKSGKVGGEMARAVGDALRSLREYIWWGELAGTFFRGLSLAAVLLVAALGLAITFGLMGVINMAHGELIMVGAYTAYVTQNFFKGMFGSAGIRFDHNHPVISATASIGCDCLGVHLWRWNW